MRQPRTRVTRRRKIYKNKAVAATVKKNTIRNEDNNSGVVSMSADFQ